MEFSKSKYYTFLSVYGCINLIIVPIVIFTTPYNHSFGHVITAIDDENIKQCTLHHDNFYYTLYWFGIEGIINIVALFLYYSKARHIFDDTNEEISQYYSNDRIANDSILKRTIISGTIHVISWWLTGILVITLGTSYKIFYFTASIAVLLSQIDIVLSFNVRMFGMCETREEHEIMEKMNDIHNMVEIPAISKEKSEYLEKVMKIYHTRPQRKTLIKRS